MYPKEDFMIVKLSPPQINPGIISRPRLLNRFIQNSQWRFGYLSAPAGFGKTVLMSQVAAALKQNIWYQLDANDNEPVLLLKYLTAGLEPFYPGLKNKTASWFAARAINIHELITAVVNELKQKPQELLIVFDEFHHLTETRVHYLIRDLVMYLPGVRVLIGGHSVPPAIFTKLLAGEGAYQLTPEDLRFTREEIRDFISRQPVEVTEELIAGLENKTAGWPVALNLLANSSYLEHRLLPKVDLDTIYQHLAVDALEQLPAKMREFLIATSILEDLNPNFCDLLLNRADSELILDYLAKQQIFVFSLAGRPKIYRCFPLFRDFLAGRLGAMQRFELLRRAGELFSKKGDLEQAIECSLAAGIYEEAIEMIAGIGELNHREGDQAKVAGWLEKIPTGKISEKPQLAGLFAGIKYDNGALPEAEKWANRALERFIENHDQAGIAKMISLKARIAFSRGDIWESKRLLESGPDGDTASRKHDLFNTLPCLIFFSMGRIDLAIQMARERLAEAERHRTQYATERISRILVTLHYFEGDYHRALEIHQKSLETAGDPNLAFCNAAWISSIYRDWGELDQAFEFAKQSVAAKEKLDCKAMLPCAYYELAMVNFERGELTGAEEYLRRSIQVAQETKEGHYIPSLSRVHLALIFSMQGRGREAQAMVEDAFNEARSDFDYVKAVCQVIGGLVLMQNEGHTEGYHVLKNALKVLERMKVKYPLCLCHGFLAGILWRQMNGQLAGLKSAARCLQIAAQGNFIQIFVTLFPQLEPVLRMGIEYNFEIPLIQNVLWKLGGRGMEILHSLAVHPDPEVRLRILMLMAETGTPESKTGVANFLNDKEQHIRDKARAILDQMSGKPDQSETELFRIQSLGSFTVSTTGENPSGVGWPTKKSRDILAYLAHQEKPVSRERILEEIWPDSDSKKITPLFHTTIYHLRQALQKTLHGRNMETITYQNGEYQLAPGIFSSDRMKLKRIFNEIPAEIHSETVGRLEEVVALYQGDYLEELDYDWVLSEREYLRRIYMEARLKLAKYYLHIHQYSGAIHHLIGLNRMNPLSEELGAMLMKAYAAIGDRLAIKRHYETFKQMLQDELGLAPSAEIRNLYYQLCSSEKQAVNYNGQL
jgi:LuxR family maltose regulon positive regulatory protein